MFNKIVSYSRLLGILLIICIPAHASPQTDAQTCPDFTRDTSCVGFMTGSSCNGWRVQGNIYKNSRFSQVSTRSTFPFLVTCSYDQGRLALVRLQQAIPTAPYLWSTQNISGLSFNVCSTSLENCSFTLG